jgi:modulator of FtsH protease
VTPVERWSDFFVATAGAAAALAGLVIVAVSVNVREILQYRQLPARAAAAIASLVLALVVSIAGLAPQPVLAYGLEALVLGAAAWAIHVASGRITWLGSRASGRPVHEPLQVIVLGQAQTLPVLIGAALVTAGAPAGEYVVFAGILAIFPLAVLDAWVLLIEILR